MNVVATYLHDSETPIRDQIRTFLAEHPASSATDIANGLSHAPKVINGDIQVALSALFKGNWLARQQGMDGSGLTVWLYSINEASPRYGYAEREDVPCSVCGKPLPKIRHARTGRCDNCEAGYSAGYKNGYNAGYYAGQRRAGFDRTDLEKEVERLKAKAAEGVEAQNKLTIELHEARQEIARLMAVTLDAPSAPTTKHISATRICLRCKSMFESAWAGERICGSCRNSADVRESHMGEQ